MGGTICYAVFSLSMLYPDVYSVIEQRTVVKPFSASWFVSHQRYALGRPLPAQDMHSFTVACVGDSAGLPLMWFSRETNIAYLLACPASTAIWPIAICRM